MASNQLSALLLFVSSTISMICACSPVSDETEALAKPDTQRTFGAEEKRIARALSIGGNQMPGTASPQDQAMLCDISLQSIVGRLTESGALSAEQKHALSRARTLFRERAANGRSASQIAAARRSLSEAHPEQAERARIAIGCLRDLS